MPRKKKSEASSEPVLAVNLVCQNCHHVVATMFSVSASGLRQVAGTVVSEAPAQVRDGVEDELIARQKERMRQIEEKRKLADITRNRDRDLRHRSVEP